MLHIHIIFDAFWLTSYSRTASRFPRQHDWRKSVLSIVKSLDVKHLTGRVRLCFSFISARLRRSRCIFLELPVDLRLTSGSSFVLIKTEQDLLFVNGCTACKFKTSVSPEDLRPIKLLHTCRQIRHEAVPSLYNVRELALVLCSMSVRLNFGHVCRS